MKKPNDWLKYDKRDGRKGRGKKALAKASRSESSKKLTKALEHTDKLPDDWFGGEKT